MDIVGNGIDATDIRRIAESIERWGDRFVARVFTAGEIAYCRRKRDFASSFAARFAAKEAAKFSGSELRTLLDVRIQEYVQRADPGAG